MRVKPEVVIVLCLIGIGVGIFGTIKWNAAWGLLAGLSAIVLFVGA